MLWNSTFVRCYSISVICDSSFDLCDSCFDRKVYLWYSMIQISLHGRYCLQLRLHGIRCLVMCFRYLGICIEPLSMSMSIHTCLPLVPPEPLQPLCVLDLLIGPPQHTDPPNQSLLLHVLSPPLKKRLHVELPLLVWKSVVSEVALIDANDDCVFHQELGNQSTDPETLLIVAAVPVLGIGFVQLLEPKVELDFH